MKRLAIVPALLLTAQTTATLSKLPAPRAIAYSPQAATYAVVEPRGTIAHVVAQQGWVPFVNTGGDPVALAFDVDGNLYVADQGRKAILKITPWAEITEAARNLSSPEAVTVTPDGRVFYVNAGRVYGLDGKRVSDLEGATAIVASETAVYAGDRAGRVGPAERLRPCLDEPIGSLARDQRGNLYAVGKNTGRVAGIAADGKRIADLAAAGVHTIMFAGLDAEWLYASEPSNGTITKLQPVERGQTQPWERREPFRIVSPIDGAILNRHDGAPAVRITGVTRSTGGVRVNGVKATLEDNAFTAELRLNPGRNTITAISGSKRDSIVVYYDDQSAGRYRISTDDNIFWLADLAQHTPPYESIFDNPYLAMWRDLNRKYGAKVHFNIYYETPGGLGGAKRFDLTQMPDRYKTEWQRNADWMRLSFHARANNPDRPYLHATAGQIRDDYRLVTREIERFAGKELLSPVTTIHWGEVTEAGARALRAEGVTTMAGYFELRREIPGVSYYVATPQLKHLSGRDYWKDNENGITFIRHDMVLNGVKIEDIIPRLNRLAADPHQSEILELMIHEQHFYPGWTGHVPDYRERMERAIQWVTEKGYKPVLFDDDARRFQ